MILVQTCFKVVCQLLVLLLVLLTIDAQFRSDASSFSVSARTEYFEGVVGSEGSTFSAPRAYLCVARDDAALPTCEDMDAGDDADADAYDRAFSGRITLPKDVRLRVRRGDGPLNQIFRAPGERDAPRVRLTPADGGEPRYAELPLRIDLPSVGSGAPLLINLTGQDAQIGAIPTRDTSGLRNALRSGEIEVYGIGLWWQYTGDDTAPVAPTRLFKVGGQELRLGDSVSFSSEGRDGPEAPLFWATLGFDADGVIEVSLRAVGDAAVVERFGGSGLLLQRSWLDTLIGDPLMQLIWSLLGTLIAIAGIQFLGQGEAGPNRESAAPEDGGPSPSSATSALPATAVLRKSEDP